MRAILFAILFLAISAQKVTVPAEWRVSQTGTWVAWPIFTFLNGVSPLPQFTEMIAIISQSQKVYILVNSRGEENTAIDYIKTWNAASQGFQVNFTQVEWFQIQHTDFWLRDYLLFGKAGTETKVVSFNFNEWGYAEVSNYFRRSATKDNKIAEKVGEALDVTVVFSNITTEPGGLEFNDESDNPNYRLFGKRLILSEACLLQRERTLALGTLMTKREIHNELLRIFDLDDIIWLPLFRYSAQRGEYAVPQCAVTDLNPLSACNRPSSSYYTIPSGGGLVADESAFSGPQLDPEDNESLLLTPLTTNGHTDEYVKWCGPNHVLLAYVPGTYAAETMEGRTQRRLRVIEDILVRKKINVYRIPTAPEKVYNVSSGSGTFTGYIDMSYSSSGYYTNEDLIGELVMTPFTKNGFGSVPIVAARSYFNMVITNEHVIVPAYGDAQRDGEALSVLRQVFEAPGNPSGRSRKVVQVLSADSINTGGGGMHCITQNQPI